MTEIAMTETPITSPCTGVCAYDPATGWCLGCGRTQAEIGGWRDATLADRDAVWAALPERLARLGVAVRRPSLTPEALRERVRATLGEPGGCWVVGLHGAVAEMPVRRPLVASATTLVASGRGGALRLGLPDHARLLEATDAHGRLTALVLAVQRVRLGSPPAIGLAECGPDSAALDSDARHHRLFDLGLGSAAARFMVRTDQPALIARLRALLGADLPTLLREGGAALVAASPVRVVETALARAEVSAPIPPQGERSPEGCHTHLLPGAMALRRETPPGLDLPEAYACAALFYPAAPQDEPS